jgi:hypothetical protein
VGKSFLWLRRALPFLGLLIAAALLYDGFVFYSRWSSNRSAAEAQEERQAEERNAVVKTVGEGLKIVSFYAAPSKIARGGHANLCYGVSGAANVRIEPPVDAVWPALTRCVPVSPSKDTEYKLIAEDGKGASASKSTAVAVR